MTRLLENRPFIFGVFATLFLLIVVYFNEKKHIFTWMDSSLTISGILTYLLPFLTVIFILFYKKNELKL